MSKPLVTYFAGIRARVEGILLVLEFAGVEYDLKQITFAEWPLLKPGVPFNQIPSYKDDVVGEHGQSHTILRYLARTHGLEGKTETEKFSADEIYECSNDLMTNVTRNIFGKKRAEVEECKAAFLESGVKPWLQRLENYLTAHNGGEGWFVGDDVTYADLGIYHVINNFVRPLDKDLFAQFPKLVAHRARVEALPKIAAYIASDRRPATTTPSGVPFVDVLNTPEELV
eukprot:TRINITY_DN11068_c0_g1_i1.p1 TRINITY_DN11068_c0_g1~~TRINITY_DN11068_c0_g1_i1.p1  ORF type:complete len:241 (+),score=63.72 TRINITY_DN11068_c0_g1_i1:40-723(+)